MAETLPQIFCPGCGTVLEDYAARLVEKDRVIHDLEIELRAKRSTIGRMKGDRDGQDKLDPHYDDAMALFAYWKGKLAPAAREMSGERLRKVLARLRGGATLEELKEAVDGCEARPYVSEQGRTAHGRADQKEVELELICREEKNVARFRKYALASRETDTSGARTARAGSTVTEPQIEDLRLALTDPLVVRLNQLRGWTAEAIFDLELGLDARSGRVSIPIRDGAGELVGVCRYQPNPGKRGRLPKMLAEGSRDLFPAPERIHDESLWLVEGEPDAIAMWSIGLRAVAIPGIGKWREEWVERFRGFERVKIVFDCDDAGRKAAAERQAQLAHVADAVVVELDPARSDGYDVGDLVIEHGAEAAAKLEARIADPRTVSSTVKAISRKRERDPWEPPPYRKICEALEAAGCRVKDVGEGRAEAQCPVHDDRVPSLSVTEGDDQRVLLHCQAGCDPEDVIASLGFEWRELFAA